MAQICDKITDAVIAKIIEDGLKLVDTEKIVKSIVPVLEKSIKDTVTYILVDDSYIMGELVSKVLCSKMMADHISSIIETAFNVNKPVKKAPAKKK